jgi:hypothetical protein
VSEGWLRVTLTFIWAVVLAQVVLLLYWMVRHGLPWRVRTQESFIASVQTPDVECDRLLIVREADDESGSIMALAQLSGWLAETFSRLARPRMWEDCSFVLIMVFLVLGWVVSDKQVAAVFLLDTVAFVRRPSRDTVDMTTSCPVPSSTPVGYRFPREFECPLPGRPRRLENGVAGRPPTPSIT